MQVTDEKKISKNLCMSKKSATFAANLKGGLSFFKFFQEIILLHLCNTNYKNSSA